MFDLRPATLKARYASGDLTPRRLLREIREKAAAMDPEFHLFIHLLSEAEQETFLFALERMRPEEAMLQPLYGIPFAIKDNIDLADIPTTAACPDFAYTPEKSATVVERLIALGAIPVGKTNLDQFATGLSGTRSPYGVCRNSAHPDYPAGGSSSGSALAVALGVASFALGTDTAGSGRVPAAWNDLVGLKASRGLISTAGLVPACRTLDSVTFFTASAAEASRLFTLAARYDPADAYSRVNPSWNREDAFGGIRPGFRFGVPERLEFMGCAESELLFAEAIARLRDLGGVPVGIDFSPFLEAARLLYEGPWLAERQHVVGPLMEKNPEAVLPVIRAVLSSAANISGVAVFRAQYRLQSLKAECDRALASLECVVTPPYPRPITLAELAADPIGKNAELGYYTNFMNLLDYAAVAVPAGRMKNGLPWGVTLFGRVFTDQYLLSLAHALQCSGSQPPVGCNPPEDFITPARPAGNDRLRIAVCGAHLAGEPLNHQLTGRGARLIAANQSAPRYRMYAFSGTPVRPGMIRAEGGDGTAIALEVWELPQTEVASFLAGIAPPLGLGKVELEDGSWECGFICAPEGLDKATDISRWGGWRAWRASL
ncbi:MAG: allophanate hydrolase [Zoogloeaceae bacterium]|jgi:allophanate hydrolase|nr:allophanate hydrolase [Zoogloeaceae bacterium]